MFSVLVGHSPSLIFSLAAAAGAVQYIPVTIQIIFICVFSGLG